MVVERLLQAIGSGFEDVVFIELGIWWFMEKESEAVCDYEKCSAFVPDDSNHERDFADQCAEDEKDDGGDRECEIECDDSFC